MLLRTVTDSPASPSGPSVRVLIADDQVEFVRGLGVVLSLDDQIEVVGEAENGEEAIARTIALLPDVVLLDVNMPGINGLEAARVINQQAPIARIVMLTASDEDDDLYEAIRVGARGYLRKDLSVAQVAQAIHAAARGQSLVSAPLATRLLSEFRRNAPGGADGPPPGTPRELEVLELVAKGMSHREIGAQLLLSEKLVESHIHNLLEKLHRRQR